MKAVDLLASYRTIARAVHPRSENECYFDFEDRVVAVTHPFNTSITQFSLKREADSLRRGGKNWLSAEKL